LAYLFIVKQQYVMNMHSATHQPMRAALAWERRHNTRHATFHLRGWWILYMARISAYYFSFHFIYLFAQWNN